MPTDADLYRAPTLALLSALVAVFGALWLQGRSQPGRGAHGAQAPSLRRRRLLWLAGWTFATVRIALLVFRHDRHGLGLAVASVCMQMASLMFLASLAPQYFSNKPRILYVVAFGGPLMLFAVIVALDPHPGYAVRALLIVLCLAAMCVAARWSLERHLVPEWLSLLIVGLVGADCFYQTVGQQYDYVLGLVHGGVLLMTAFLFAFEFRRLTAGVVFTVGGLMLWSGPAFFGAMAGRASMPVPVARILNLVKVITAVGMVVLVLEDEIASNHAAQQRDRRARMEMERYTEIYLAAMPFDEETRQYDQACEAIVSVSRFRQAALFLRSPEGSFRLAGRAGMDGALEGALDALALRTNDEKVREAAASKYVTREIGNLMRLDLSPFMEPGDELKHMNFRSAHVIGIRARDGRLLGALVLAGLRKPEEPLLTEDVLPMELLVSRIGAAREQQGLLRRLVQSERLAGLGQLAGGVAHELNNPLTVVTGYAELMAESEGTVARDQALVILNEARRMKQIIESLMRFRKASSAERAPVSVSLLLQDIEKLAHRDLEAAKIELQMRIPEELPRVRANGDQIRQVFLQLLKNAMGSIEELPDGTERRLMVEASPSGAFVQITFSDTGPGFAEPNRAFDPFFTTRHPGEGVGLGLSICYSIIREHGGEISAVNLHPRGAAVVVELPIDESTPLPDPVETLAEGRRRTLVADSPTRAI